MSKPITKAESVKYMRMALALYGIAADPLTCELIMDTWDEIEKKGGAFSIKDSVELEWRLRKKHQVIKAVKLTKEAKKQKR